MEKPTRARVIHRNVRFAQLTAAVRDDGGVDEAGN